jgi:hypothetical protein
MQVIHNIYKLTLMFPSSVLKLLLREEFEKKEEKPKEIIKWRRKKTI